MCKITTVPVAVSAIVLVIVNAPLSMASAQETGTRPTIPRSQLDQPDMYASPLVRFLI